MMEEITPELVIATIGITIICFIVFLLIYREIVAWIFKVNVMVRELKTNNKLNREILAELAQIAKNTSKN